MVKCALVTGAGRGIGRQVALQFAQRGWHVLGLDKAHPELLDTPAVPEKEKVLQRIAPVQFDLRASRSEIRALVNGDERIRNVDTLVNCAGTLECPTPDLGGEGLGFTEQQGLDIMQVNLHAPVSMIEALAPTMLAKGAGRIVNVGSVSAFTGHPDLFYGASKAALLNITKTFASLLGRHGILVNAVAPGPTLTDMYHSLPQSRKDMVTRTVNSGRPAQPAEVASAVVWLGTESSPYINGATIDVNDSSYPR